MSGTIESINGNIISKLDCLEKIADIVDKQDVILIIKRLKEEYELGSIKTLAEYYILIKNGDIPDKQKLDHLYREFQMFIRGQNILGRMNSLYKRLAHIKMPGLRALFSKYNNIAIQYSEMPELYSKCMNCSRPKTPIAASSEMVCLKCGETEYLNGTVFEDEQFYYQEGQRTKHGTYVPLKHCRDWINNIQAREQKIIPKSVLDDVKNCIRRDNIRNIDDITCKKVRKYLSQTKNTTFNDHVPLIRKKITGIEPPQLTEQEIQGIILIFGKVVKIYEEIKPVSKTNVPYHPYLIYKIIEHLLKHERNIRRKKMILACIHLQSSDTLIDNDKTWEKICHRLGNIDYMPTDRNRNLDV
jgi:hypothetical protein